MKRNLDCLTNIGQLRLAMKLAMGLMKHGSYQVEMSDEGLMAENSEDCLSEVIKALTKCDSRAVAVIAWCTAMLEADRSGFIATEALEALRNLTQTAGEK